MSYVTAAQLASETNPTGASLVGFLQSGTSAVGRTLQDKLQEFVSVKDFGAHGDGSTDDTAAIQAAINAAGSGRGVFFPGGTYLLSATLTVSNGEVTLFGENMFGCELLQTGTGLNILDVTGANFRLHGLSFYYSATPVFPATAISLNASDAELSSFVVRNAWVGVSIQGGGNLILRDFQIGDFGSIGLLFNNSGAGGGIVSNFTINAGSATAGASGCVVFSDQVEGVILAHGEILEGVNSLVTFAASYTVGNRPAYCTFSDVYFDSSAQGSSVADLVESEFIGCWFSAGRSGGGHAGLALNNSESVRFTNCRFFNCGSYGCEIAATVARISFLNCAFDANSVTSGSGAAHGLFVAGSTSYFNVIGCTASNDLYPGGQQGYGIFISSGCSNFNIIGNLLEGNITGGLGGAASGAHSVVTGNTGYISRNEGTTSIASRGSAAVVTHGLTGTPTAAGITVTPTTSWAGSGAVNFFVTDISATTFTIAVNAVLSATMDFAWSARLANG